MDLNYHPQSGSCFSSSGFFLYQDWRSDVCSIAWHICTALVSSVWTGGASFDHCRFLLSGHVAWGHPSEFRNSSPWNALINYLALLFLEGKTCHITNDMLACPFDAEAIHLRYSYTFVFTLAITVVISLNRWASTRSNMAPSLNIYSCGRLLSPTDIHHSWMICTSSKRILKTII